jgi:hypothetical protein
MYAFLKNTILFFSFWLSICICLIISYTTYYNISANDIPAPNISDSYSFNEKMQFLRNSPKKASIIGLGSSLCLNNLHSKTIIETLNSENYLNASSWGMSMEDDFFLLKVLTRVYHPTTLIITGSISDFEKSKISIRYTFLEDYLLSHKHSSIWYHYNFFNVPYYITNLKFAKQVRSASDKYEYLDFDPFGGVNLNDSCFKINDKRWNTVFEIGSTTPSSYEFLDSISVFCKQNKIKLLFFQSPIRNGLYSNFGNDKLTELTAHVNKIENILKRNGHIFINSNTLPWDDNLFVDGEHLNTKGAKLFTEYCFNKTGDNTHLKR